MRYIKLFEKFVNDVKFYRFNHNDLLGEESEKELTPSMRSVIGSDEFNEALVIVGFPDKKKCVHFLDSVAFDPSFKSIYGQNIYNIEIDNQSKIGWSFYAPINEWYYLPRWKFKTIDIEDISLSTPIDLDYDDPETTKETIINQSVERIKSWRKFFESVEESLEDIKWMLVDYDYEIYKTI